MVLKKKKTTQIAAIIALFAIIISIVWTGILVVVSSWNNANAPTFDVEELIKSYSWNLDTSTGTTFSWEIDPNTN